MVPLNNSEIRGNWATLMLPINADGSIGYDRLIKEINSLIAMQVDGIYSNGTAGEFYAQTEQEFDRVSALLAERCNAAEMPFQIGVSHMSPQLSLRHLKRVKSLEPSAMQVILPDWVPPTDEEAIRFLQRMAEEAHPIGLVLYNPPQAKRVLTPKEISRLKTAVPSLVGVKVADGDKDWYAAMREHTAELSVFVPGHHLATGYRLGAQGAYSNVACLHPETAQRWSDQMESDLDAALELEERIRQFMDVHVRPLTEQGYSNQAVDKLLAAIGDWANVGTRLRWPYEGIPSTEADRLRPVARNLLPEFF